LLLFLIHNWIACVLWEVEMDHGVFLPRGRWTARSMLGRMRWFLLYVLFGENLSINCIILFHFLFSLVKLFGQLVFFF
jgi:hypothetical protein